ncbi:hypothetical protein [Oceanobacillus sp. CAU 1775]
MCIIQVFNGYMEEHHPHLLRKDWKTEVRTITATETNQGDIKSLIPAQKKEDIKCWYFFYDESFNDMVFLLQDKRGVNNIAISLMQNGIPVNPITFH